LPLIFESLLLIVVSHVQVFSYFSFVNVIFIVTLFFVLLIIDCQSLVL